MAIFASASEQPTFCTRIDAASFAGMVRNGTTWHRETMVGRMLEAVRPSRMMTTSSGGSSSVFRKAFAAEVPMRSTSSTM